MCDMTHPNVCHDAFQCVPWLIPMCTMTHSNVCHDSFQYATWLIATHTLSFSRCAITHPQRPCHWKGVTTWSSSCGEDRRSISSVPYPCIPKIYAPRIAPCWYEWVGSYIWMRQFQHVNEWYDTLSSSCAEKTAHWSSVYHTHTYRGTRLQLHPGDPHL